MTTPNLGLSSTSESAGSAVTFLTWRLAQDNTTSSNMTKIDAWVGEASGSITILKTNTMYSGSAIDSGASTYTSTITGITAYTVGTVIILKVDATSVGTTTLNINSLGAKSIYKVSSNGVAVELTAGDLILNTYNTFIFTSGDYWLWVAATGADQISIPGSVDEIVTISGSGIKSSGISINSITPTTASYVVLELNSGLANEWLFISGSGATLVRNASASTIRIDVSTSAPFTTASGSVALGTVTPLGVNTSGSLALGIVTPLGVGTSGSLRLGISGTPLGVDASGSLALGIVAPLGVGTSGSLRLGIIAPLGVSSTGSLALGISNPIQVNSATGSLIIASASPLGIGVSGSLTLGYSTGLALDASGSLILAVSGVTSGSYNKIEVDSYGRVISGSVTAGGTGGGHVIYNASGSFTQRANLNFIGAGITVTDVVSASATQAEVDWNMHSTTVSASATVTIPTGVGSVVAGAVNVVGQLVINGTMVIL